ncbi:MAG: hypothetical protein LBP79_01085 [Clostridiales bacterium]|jgi:23S rRNA (uracil1939-C5)-methyltransferase|nr:hypothetical protein [Clostridiales bacterium]
MKDNYLELKISKYGRDGRGAVFLNGVQYAVEGALKDETVRVEGGGKIFKTAEIIVPSPHRVTVECPCFSRCGGCDLLFADYGEQLRIKKAAVAENLKRVVSKELISDTVGMFYPYRYRNKIHIAFTASPKGVKAGFFEEGSKRVTDYRGCLLHEKSADVLVRILKDFISNNGVKIRDENKKTEGVRYAAARFLDGGLMLTVVSSHTTLPEAAKLYAALAENFKEVSLYLNVNKSRDSAIFSDKFVHLFGKPQITGKLCGIRFDYYPSAFIQINDNIAARVYNDVLSAALIDKDTTVLDLYSGIGLTSVMFAKKCARVISVELSKDAVKAASALKKSYRLSDKIVNICGDAGAELAKLSLEYDEARLEVKAVNTIRQKNYEASAVRSFGGLEIGAVDTVLQNNYEARIYACDNRTRAEYVSAPRRFFAASADPLLHTGYISAPTRRIVVFADPPRTGLSEKVVNGLLRLKPEQIVYLSCNPESLSKNLADFSGEYEIKSLVPYDMFPQTRHIEVLAVLNRKERV